MRMLRSAMQYHVHFLTIDVCVQGVSSSQSANHFTEFDVVVFLPCLPCACCAQRSMRGSEWVTAMYCLSVVLVLMLRLAWMCAGGES